VHAQVSASRSSPMGDTLDACGRFTDGDALGALAPRLAQLIKRGVGVNTRRHRALRRGARRAPGLGRAAARRRAHQGAPHLQALVSAAK